MKAVAVAGTVAMIGVLTGTRAPVDTGAILRKSVKVQGVYVGSVTMFEGLVAALETNRIEPVIDRVFPFEEARAAYDHLASGAHFGKVVITV